MKINEEYIKNWAAAAGVRAVKTVAQTALASVGTAAVLGAVDWRMVASASLMAGVLSLLTSVTGLPEVEQLPDASGTASGAAAAAASKRATAAEQRLLASRRPGGNMPGLPDADGPDADGAGR